MFECLQHKLRRLFASGALAVAALVSVTGAANAAVIAPGAQIANVPAALFDPLSMLTDPLPAGGFLLPIEITGANGLQDWSFDLTFDQTVVAPLDVGGLYQGVYQAEFSVADPTF